MIPKTENPAGAWGAAGLGSSFLAGNDPRINQSTSEWQQSKSGSRQNNSRIDFAAVNRAALAALPAVLARIVPGGKIIAGEYVALNPTRADRRPGSFRINTRTGRWADFATADKGGDPVALVAYVERTSQVEAARLLGKMLGLESEGLQ